MVTTVPSSTTITITMPSNESGSGATTSGGIRVQHYYPVGTAVQEKGFGWGLGSWGGEAAGAITTTLNGALLNDTAGTGGSGTSITLTSTANFPSSGTNFIQVGTEEISYTGVSGNDITGCTRGANSTTAATHADGTTVTQFDNGGVPRNIVRTPDNNYLLYPYPDKQYTLVFDYFTFPSDLSAHGDTTTIPDRFGPVIVDGASAFVYQYRGEIQQYQLNFGRFEQGIKNMQSLLINKYEYVRSTVLITPRGSANYMSGVIS